MHKNRWEHKCISCVYVFQVIFFFTTSVAFCVYFVNFHILLKKVLYD